MKESCEKTMTLQVPHFLPQSLKKVQKGCQNTTGQARECMDDGACLVFWQLSAFLFSIFSFCFFPAFSAFFSFFPAFFFFHFFIFSSSSFFDRSASPSQISSRSLPVNLPTTLSPHFPWLSLSFLFPFLFLFFLFFRCFFNDKRCFVPQTQTSQLTNNKRGRPDASMMLFFILTWLVLGVIK